MRNDQKTSGNKTAGWTLLAVMGVVVAISCGAVAAQAQTPQDGQLFPPKEEDVCKNNPTTAYVTWGQPGGDTTGQVKCVDQKNNLSVAACVPNAAAEGVQDGTASCTVVRNVMDIAACPAGQALRATAAGAPVCEGHPINKSCPAGQLISGIDVSGNVTCMTPTIPAMACTGGTVMGGINADGTPRCVTLVVASMMCPAGQYLAGISSGSPVCRTP